MNYNNETIKKFRLDLGLTQHEFANEIGIHLRSLQRWESGVSEPSPLAINNLKTLEEKIKVNGYEVPLREKRRQPRAFWNTKKT